MTWEGAVLALLKRLSRSLHKSIKRRLNEPQRSIKFTILA